MTAATPVSGSHSERTIEVLTRELAQARGELAEAHRREAATGEVLQIIARSPGDLEPAIAAIARNAVTVCDALLGSVFSYDGTLLHFVAEHGFPGDARQTLKSQYPLAPRGTNLDAIEARDIVHIVDVREDTRTANLELVRTLD